MRLTCKEFAACLDDVFVVQLSLGQTLKLILTEVEDRGRRSLNDQEIEQFSLLFSGPAEPLLPQAIYQFQHDRLGEVDIFIVPVGLVDEAISYQAIFN